jgi:hypothetical protein
VNIQQEHGVEYESPTKYRPSNAAMQQYRLKEQRTQLNYKRNYLASRQEKSNLSHINRMRSGIQSRGSEHENNYNYE